MFANNRRGWRRCLAGIAALALSASAWAHGPAVPGKIEFLPPPMEGTLSLGIYDAAGKLVRVLHREAEISELTAGIDGLITQWDGKDDQGAPCPTGSYRARGVMVGELSVEGIDFIGNDWVTDDDSPRIRRITGLGVNPEGYPIIEVVLAGQSTPVVYVLTRATTGSGDFKFTPLPAMPRPAITVRDGKIEGVTVPGLNEPVVDASLGEEGFVWAIVGTTLKKFSKKGDLVRTLEVNPGDPPPVKVAAAPNRKTFYVLSEDARLQRLSGYDIALVGVTRGPGAEGPRDKAISFRQLFKNDILASDRYEQIASQLKFPDGKPFTPAETVTVTLLPNPLLKNKRETLQIRAAVDKEGSYLATADGLPLCRISESKALLWAVIGQVPSSKALLLFDSDGAVVEEFQIAKPGQMMTFDAGAIPWTAAAPSPEPGASATPSPSASPATSPVVQPPVEAVPSPVPAATAQPSTSPSATLTPVP